MATALVGVLAPVIVSAMMFPNPVNPFDWSSHILIIAFCGARIALCIVVADLVLAVGLELSNWSARLARALPWLGYIGAANIAWVRLALDFIGRQRDIEVPRTMIDVLAKVPMASDAVVGGAVLVLLSAALRTVVTRGTPVVSTCGLEEIDEAALGDDRDNVRRTKKYLAICHALMIRAQEARRSAMLALGGMVMVVVVGGALTLGIIVYPRTRDLDQLNGHIVKMQRIEALFGGNGPTDADPKMPTDAECKIMVARARIDSSPYSKIKLAELETVLAQIRQGATVNWSELALRISAGVFTLLLAQVFFGMYRRETRTRHALLSDAMALRLISDEDAARRLLEQELSRKLPFSGAPTDEPSGNPQEAALQAVERVLAIAQGKPGGK